MTSNGTIRISGLLFRDWLRLPEHIGVVGLEFDGRTITAKIHDLHYADADQAEYMLTFEASSHYELKDIVRSEAR